MSTFKTYSNYYDLIYKSKDYGEEADYIHSLLTKYQSSAKQILELGCGTGGHALKLEQKGYEVTGIDSSSEMLSMAREKSKDSIRLIESDILDYRESLKYGAVISLFHVMSYMRDIGSLDAAFQTAAYHLDKNGIFIFDCWHGPGVLTENPEERLKTFENEKVIVKRRSIPEWIKEKKLVNVKFDILITEKESGREEHLEELHPMRYWFKDEILAALLKNGFGLMGAEEWLTGKPLADGCWNACYVAKKVR